MSGGCPHGATESPAEFAGPADGAETEQLDFGRAVAGLDGLGAHECGTEIFFVVVAENGHYSRILAEFSFKYSALANSTRWTPWMWKWMDSSGVLPTSRLRALNLEVGTSSAVVIND